MESTCRQPIWAAKISAVLGCSSFGDSLLCIEACSDHVRVTEAIIDDCDINVSSGVLHVVGSGLAPAAVLRQQGIQHHVIHRNTLGPRATRKE